MGFAGVLENDGRLLEQSLSKPGVKLRWTGLAIASLLLYGTFTNILVWTPALHLNPTLEPLNAVPIALAAVTTALLLALAWGGGAGATPKSGMVGSLAGLFATACPFCQPVWLVWLGLGQASLFLGDIGTGVAMASLALLLYALHMKLNESCGVGKKR